VKRKRTDFEVVADVQHTHCKNPLFGGEMAENGLDFRQCRRVMVHDPVAHIRVLLLDAGQFHELSHDSQASNEE
jgi:hypothetical protein